MLSKIVALLVVALAVFGCGGQSSDTQTVRPAVAQLAKMSTASVMPQSGWWWNPNEGGRGFTIETQNGSIFMAAYMYDATGNAVWYAAGPGTLTNASFTAPLLTYSGGQTLTGDYRPPTGTTSNGDISITFSDSTHGVITWPNGATTAIQRYDIVPGGSNATAAVDAAQTGWWWNSAEGGRGFSIEIQNDTMFMSGYMYDGNGKPVWYASGPTAMNSSTTYTGVLQQYSGGQTLTGPYKSASLTNANLGNITVTFNGTSTATLKLPNGTLMALTRYQYGAPPNGTIPDAPTITNATGSNGMAALAFTAPASAGGSSIGYYTAACTDGNVTYTGSAVAGPINVRGLTNGATYSCSIKAINATGSSAASSGLSVTPTLPTVGTGTYTITGTITGLTGTIELKNNGGDNLVISSNGKFTFAKSVASGNTFKVSVATQPSGQNCTVAAGNGTISTGNIDNIFVYCSIKDYYIIARVMGFKPGLILQNMGQDSLNITYNGGSLFGKKLYQGDTYNVTIYAQPPGLSCIVSNGSGTVWLEDINISVTCQEVVTIGGTLTGLPVTVILKNNGEDVLTMTEPGTFQLTVRRFSTYQITASTTAYNVFCRGTSYFNGYTESNVTNINVECVCHVIYNNFCPSTKSCHDYGHICGN